MGHRESGIVAYDTPSSQRIEVFARVAYETAGVPIADPPGLGILFEVLIGPILEYVDIGIPPGTVEMEFNETGVIAVRMDGRQSLEDCALATARAIARYVAWVVTAGKDDWADRLLDAVALAIVMPEAAFRTEMEEMTTGELAYSFQVSESMVLERARMLRGGHDSGERMAITGLAP